MFGAGGIGGGINAAEGVCDGTAGVTPRAVLELFRVLKEREGQYEYSVKVSMFELYRDGLRDLVSRRGPCGHATNLSCSGVTAWTEYPLSLGC